MGIFATKNNSDMKNNEKMLCLSESEMLDLWKLKRQLLPVRKDCIIEREDGIDIDEYLLLEIREWYAQLINTAPAEWLPCKNIADQITVNIDNFGIGTVLLPHNCVRPIELRMADWEQSITEFFTPDTPVAILQRNEYSRTGSESPIAVISTGEVTLYGCKTRTLSKAICIMRPTASTYEFAEIALSTIKI